MKIEKIISLNNNLKLYIYIYIYILIISNEIFYFGLFRFELLLDKY